MKALYKSPSVRFESLHLRENIADPCWAYAANNKASTFYYDTPGTGYIKFTLTGNSCGNAKIEVVEKVPGDNSANIDAILNKGQSFTGNFSTIKPS